MQIFREALFLLLAFLDGEFTKRRLGVLGIEAELNPVVRGLCRFFGIQHGVDLGILIPTGILAIVGWYNPCFLSFAVGVRFCLFIFQQIALHTKP